jgi:phosphinothricin acetyltransferase
MTVTDARESDLPAVAEIHAAAARDTHATFDFDGHSVEWWREALAAAGQFLVARGSEGEVTGYAKSGRFMPRPAYDTTCETSVYVAAAARGRGVGRALYAELLTRLDASGLSLAVAGVAEPNEASTRLHLAFGFTRVGTFVGVGTKFGRPWDVTWYQRPLAGHP